MFLSGSALVDCYCAGPFFMSGFPVGGPVVAVCRSWREEFVGLGQREDSRQSACGSKLRLVLAAARAAETVMRAQAGQLGELGLSQPLRDAEYALSGFVGTRS